MRLRPFLQILRPPNLFTVPGDPLCGFLIASRGQWSWEILPCIAVSLAAYCAGLIINDLADFSEDLRERPSRPLPSGALSRKTALIFALLFIVIALAAAAAVSMLVVVLAGLLVAEILWYNLLAKKSALLAPVAMGLCRGISVMVGVIAAGCLGITKTYSSAGQAVFHYHTFIPAPAKFIAAGVITLYIAGVTALARKETANPRIPPLIGALIRGLLFIQAAFCVAAGGAGWIAAILLLALWPVSRLVASHFYAS